MVWYFEFVKFLIENRSEYLCDIVLEFGIKIIVDNRVYYKV